MRKEADICQLFDQEISTLGPFEKNPEIAIAISGGIDSSVLIDLASRWIRHNDGKVIALTVDHSLRKESEDEASSLNKILIAQNIEHHIIKWDHTDKPTSNIQKKARDVRYNLLTEWCKKNNVIHLLTAHHRNDQAETFYMRLERGSGIEGLSAMSKISNKNGIRILRPLLYISKQKIINYAVSNQLTWIEDPSNLNCNFQRVKIRQILGFNELFISRLAKTAINMARARASIEQNINNYMIDILEIYPENFLTINLNKFITIPEEEALTILSRTICTIGNNIDKSRFESLYRLYNNIMNKSNFITTLGGCKIIVKNNYISVSKEIQKTISRILKINSNTTLTENSNIRRYFKYSIPLTRSVFVY